MSFESFYGGRQGASFIIVYHFDGVDVPTDSDYKIKYLAVNSDGVYLYDESTKYHFIERTGSNYKDYAWKMTKLNGSKVATVPANNPTTEQTTDKDLPNEFAEGMIQCFQQGGATTNIVNYGEYVIIDSSVKEDPDNGKVYRRGMDYSNGVGGAEYIGQIVGPSGAAPEFILGQISSIPGSQGGEYSVGEGGLVPGKDGNTYHDTIKYAWANIKDEFGYIRQVLIGFEFPYLVEEFSMIQRSPYYESGDSRPEGKNIGDILSEDFELAQRIDEGDHPYWEKWKFSIPKGIKGDSLKDLEIYPSKAKRDARIYSSISPLTPSGYATGNESIDINQYDATSNYIPLVGGGYIYKDDGGKWRFRCKGINYDNRVEGETVYIDLGPYNVIDHIDFNENTGIITIYYTFDEPDSSNSIQTITDVKINTSAQGSEEEGTGNQKVSIQYKGESYTDIGAPLNYIIEARVVSADEISYSTSDVEFVNHLIVYYSDPFIRQTQGILSRTFYSNKLRKEVSGWVDLGDVGEISNLKFCASYSTVDAIPNSSSHSGKKASPEEIMGDNDYKGWLLKIGEDDNYYMYMFNYLDWVWEEVCPLSIDSADPSIFITNNPNDITGGVLKINGFYINTSTSRSTAY